MCLIIQIYSFNQVQGRSMNDDVSIDFDIDANDNHRDQAQMEIVSMF